MRAFAVRSFGEAPAIHELPIPAVDGAFLIRVRYAGVNPIDYKLLERLTATSTYPFVVGMDFAGVVERVPKGERELRAGDRVFGTARTHGAYAEYTAVAPSVKTEPLARTPDDVTDEQAAALPPEVTETPVAAETVGKPARQRRRHKSPESKIEVPLPEAPPQAAIPAPSPDINPPEIKTPGTNQEISAAEVRESVPEESSSPVDEKSQPRSRRSRKPKIPPNAT